MNIMTQKRSRLLEQAPLFVFVDLQAEYTAKGRAYALQGMKRCIHNCKRVLEYARKNGLPIAHFRQIHRGAFFNKSSEFVHWLDEFKPIHSEMIFERDLPSCYSNKAFCRLLDNMNNPHIVLLGLTGPQACLSTAVDAYHRNHDVTFLRDCSATPAMGNIPEDRAHHYISQVINLYARVLRTKDFMQEHHPKNVKWH